MTTRSARWRRSILAWRPVILLGGGLALLGWEAAQPILGFRVEWALVSAALTMMGLELFQRADESRRGDGGEGQSS
jgi:hypothetical protein